MLQASRTGPVELMNSLGRVVNQLNDVFLFTMASQSERLQLKGQSGTVESMANFLSFLKKSGAFDNVQLEQFYEDDQHEHLSYKFTVSCQFISPTAGAPPGAGQPSGQPMVPAPGQPATKRAL